MCYVISRDVDIAGKPKASSCELHNICSCCVPAHVSRYPHAHDDFTPSYQDDSTPSYQVSNFDDFYTVVAATRLICGLDEFCRRCVTVFRVTSTFPVSPKHQFAHRSLRIRFAACCSLLRVGIGIYLGCFLPGGNSARVLTSLGIRQ